MEYFSAFCDSYVYEIVKIISERSNEKLTISQNTVYTAIYKLSLAGYLSEYSKQVGKRRTRVYYHLEEKGIEYLNLLLKNYEDATEGTRIILQTFQH